MRGRWRPIDVNDFEAGRRQDFWLPLYESASSDAVRVPFIVAGGLQDGPVLGVCAAVHGNELNGIKIIHSLLKELDLRKLKGSLVCAPIVNVPSYNAGIRNFVDGIDLNHVFPGKSDGKPAEQYARAFCKTFIPSLDYLIDIHTASEGRINTMYVRSDMADPKSRQMAVDFNPQIILHAKGGDGTLRAAARRRKVSAITVEAGDPAVIQGRMVYEGEIGVLNVMRGLGMLEGEKQTFRDPVVCSSSRWIRSNTGGLLETRFKLGERVEKGQILAITRDPFGNKTNEYGAPHSGIVIGMSTNPSAGSGTRFCHLGLEGDVK
ncbi:MAG: succinylglutamate desuccinylase/aspartoacylase family protein [Vulcanimicrobiota bacterium]